MAPKTQLIGGIAIAAGEIALQCLNSLQILDYFKAHTPHVYEFWVAAPTTTTLYAVSAILMAVGLRQLWQSKNEKSNAEGGKPNAVGQGVAGDAHGNAFVGGPNYGTITTNVIHQAQPAVSQPQAKKIDNANPDCDMDWLSLTLHDLYMRDFTYTMRAGATWQIGEPVDIPGSKIEFVVPINLIQQSRFLVFYITLARNTYNLCRIILDCHEQALRFPETTGTAKQDPAPGESTSYSSDKAVFTGAVFVYYEGHLSTEQVAELTALGAQKSLKLSFRGPEYLATRKVAIAPRVHTVVPKKNTAAG